MNNTELALPSEKSLEINHMKPTRLEDSLFSKDLSPHYMQLAGKLASSELVPKSFRGKPQDLFICWAMGYQVGLTPEQSMQCIAVINGKPAMWGDDMLALCMAHKDFDDIIEEPIMDKNHAVMGYTCTVKRKGRADKINIFTLEMAKKAGLLAKGGVWIQYTDRMLKLRARGFCLRDAFPDALKGIKPREEVEDYIDAEYKVVEHSGSRTELLKMDFLNKKGVKDNGLAAELENSKIGKEVEEGQGQPIVGEAREEKDNLHIEIKRLIAEKQFTEERLTKALHFYEADSIESLDWESSDHFIQQLLRL